MCQQPPLYGQDLVYNQYIDYLRSQQVNRSKSAKLQVHRILPGHVGGTCDDPNNLVRVSYKEHTLAHLYRFLQYGQKGDKAAYLFMSNQSEEGKLVVASLAGKIGATQRISLEREAVTRFFDPAWQKKYGYKAGGKRDVVSGSLARVNADITRNTPHQRSAAGKKGGKAAVAKQRQEQKGLFDPNSSLQKKANLVRWGIEIDGRRIPFKKLSSDFVDYHIAFGTKTKYWN
jgi:hypothetical protein